MSGCFDTAWAVIKIDSDEERIRNLREATDAMYGPHKQRTMHDFGLPLDPDFERTYETDNLRFGLDEGREREGQGFAMYAKDRRDKERAKGLGLHDFENVRIEPFINRKPQFHFGRPLREIAQSGYALVGERDGKTHDLSLLGVGSPNSLAEAESREHITDIYGQTNPFLRRRDAYKKLLTGLINAGYSLTSGERNPLSNPFHEKLIRNLPKDFSATIRRPGGPSRVSAAEQAIYDHDVKTGREDLGMYDDVSYYNEAHPLAVNFDDDNQRPPEFGDLRTSDPVGIPVRIPQDTYDRAIAGHNELFDKPPENDPMGGKVQSYFPSMMVGVNRERDINKPMPTKPWRNPDE